MLILVLSSSPCPTTHVHISQCVEDDLVFGIAFLGHLEMMICVIVSHSSDVIGLVNPASGCLRRLGVLITGQFFTHPSLYEIMLRQMSLDTKEVVVLCSYSSLSSS